MKFICPNCKQEANVEIVMTDCVVSEVVPLNEDEEYSDIEIHDSINDHYQCATCGWKLPVEPNVVDDDALLDWLKEQYYNKEETNGKK